MSIYLNAIKKLPDAPGVYFFLGSPKQSEGGKNRKGVLYVGKATSLRDRVRSYFSSDLIHTRGPLLVKMLDEASAIDFEMTDSVLEALLREAALIKKYRPPYNTIGKDDKSYNHVVVTKEEYPRLFTVRALDLATTYDPDEFKYIFGPFPHGLQLREALRIIRRFFPFRGEKDPSGREKRRVSTLRSEIGLAPDFSKVPKEEYAKTIRNVKLFFEGKKKRLLVMLRADMKARARAREFEKAEKLKRQIFALEHIHDVSLLKDDRDKEKIYSNVLKNIRIEGYDVAHTSETERVGVMVVVEDGFPKKSDYRKFKIKRKRGGDIGALEEVLERRCEHTEWPLPKLIVVDGGKQQLNAAEKVLKDFGFQIPVIAVTKGVGHSPKGFLGPREYTSRHERDVLLANAEAHRFAIAFHRKKRSTQF